MEGHEIVWQYEEKAMGVYGIMGRAMIVYGIMSGVGHESEWHNEGEGHDNVWDNEEEGHESV